jgi:hypothetical protein
LILSRKVIKYAVSTTKVERYFMADKETGFIAFTGWVERRFGRRDGFTMVQRSNPRSRDAAMMLAKDAGGWIEEEGKPAHVDDYTEVDLSPYQKK